jgi:hypothetical protein
VREKLTEMLGQVNEACEVLVSLISADNNLMDSCMSFANGHAEGTLGAGPVNHHRRRLRDHPQLEFI